MPITILIDAILLLLKESKVHMENSSVNKIRNLLGLKTNKNDKWVLGDEDVTSKLINIINELLDNIEHEEPINVDSVLRRIRLEIVEDDELTGDDSLKETIVGMLESAKIQKSFDEEMNDINTLSRSLTIFFTREKLKNVCKNVNLELTRNKTRNPYKTMTSLLTELDNLSTTATDIDEEILEFSSEDVHDDKKMNELTNTIKKKHIFRTGYIDYNLMLQGGIRVPEAKINAALTHNYKTGWILSVWVSILLYNKPKPTEKKPLAVWFSMEDEVIDIMAFIYRQIMVTETGKVVDYPDMDPKELLRWVNKRLTANGWNVKIVRIKNPSDYTYRDLINKVKKYRAAGYDIQACVTDYADKLSTEGIKSTGPVGSDKKELVRRLRNFFSSIDCWWDTPWQLNPAAGDLRKSGVEDSDFLNYVHNRGYYQGVTTLGNEMDLEIFTHIVKTKNNGDWLHIRRGKHKIPSIVNKKYQSMYLPFPSDGPIPFDLQRGEPISRNSVKEDNVFYSMTSDLV